MISLFNVPHPRNSDLLSEVVLSTNIISGEYVKTFEDAISVDFDGADCVLTKDMSTAFLGVLKVLDCKAPVMMNTFNCLSSTSPIANLDLDVVWTYCDMEDGYDFNLLDMQIDVYGVKVFIHYHVAGYLTDMHKLASFCRQKEIILIEDCNSAISGYSGGKRVGTFGDIAILSFYANRYLSTLDGGAVIVNNKNIFKGNELRSFFKYGIDLDVFRTPNGEINSESDVPLVGINGLLSNAQCALAVSQLPELEHKKQVVATNYALYNELMPDDYMLQARQPSEVYPWVYFIKVDKNTEEFLEHIKNSGIQASYLHYFNHTYSGFRSKNTLPNYQRSLVALPVGWWVNEDDVEFVVQVIKKNRR